MTLEDAEREHILQVLRAADWQVGGPQGSSGSPWHETHHAQFEDEAFEY